MGGEAVVHPKILVSVRGGGDDEEPSAFPAWKHNSECCSAAEKEPEEDGWGQQLAWKCGGFLLPCKAAV